MRQLPTGTVTFLFSDIEGSTRLLQQQPDRYGALLNRHRELLRDAFTTDAGVEVETEGDAFFVAFPSAIGAVKGAVAAQRALQAEPWPDGISLRVRMGLVSGEATLQDGGYVGLDVHRAARLAAAAHGGQMLISEQTKALVSTALPGGMSIRDLGEHRLKDLDSAERIFQVVVPDLPHAFPPLRTHPATPNNLPSPLSSFLGRLDEILGVMELLEQARLVSLVGPGGVGKTRLAIEVARRMLGRYPDGVYFVALAPIREAELVVPTIAGVLGLPDRGGREPTQRLLDHLGDRRVLVVLDNFEHLQAAAVGLSPLLAGAPGLSLLVTSRGPLHLYGERQFDVPTFTAPSPADPVDDPAALLDFDAISLFVDRATAVAPSFSLTATNAGAVTRICTELDGLPLAIELAAARLALLTPQQILAQLEDRLSLRSRSRDVPARQQTLRDAIGWSYELLEHDDQKLFAGMSLFVGGASRQAVEHVLADAHPAPLEGLDSLLDNSLVRRTEVAGEARFTMLETIRTYAYERLAKEHGTDEGRRRHAEYFSELAATARSEVLGEEAGIWLDRLEQEHDNLRAVLVWATERGDAPLALRLTADLWRFWQRRGYLAEGLRRAQAALGLPGPVDPGLRAEAMDAAGGLAYWQADALTTRAMYEGVLAIRRQQGDERATAEALYNLSFSYTWLSLSDTAARPDPEAALQLLEEALALFERVGDEAGIAKTLWGIATSEFWMGRLSDAKGHTASALERARRVHDAFLIAWSLFLDGLVGLGLEELGRVHAPLAESLQMFVKSNDISAYTLVLDAFAALALATGERERAARISGAVAELEARSGTGLNRINRTIIKFDPEELRADPSLREAWAEGAAMETEDIVAFALMDAEQSG